MQSIRDAVDKVEFDIFTENQRDDIVQKALEVLSSIGISVRDDKVRSILRDNGAKVSDDIVYLPEYLVEESIESAPQLVKIFSREGEEAMNLTGENSFYGTGSDCPYILDHETHERRKFKHQDEVDAMTLCENLQNIDFVMSVGLMSESQKAADLYEFKTMVSNTKKPIIYTSQTPFNNRGILDMAQIVAGNNQKLAEKPFLMHYVEPVCPLVFPKETSEKLQRTVKAGVPVVYMAGSVPGATAPVTLAGALIQTLAEDLFGLVVSQLTKKGAPMILGAGSTPMSMRTSIGMYAAPESELFSAARSELVNHLGLPVFSQAGCSDSKTTDMQAAFEASISLTIQTLAGANLIHDIGYLESGLAGSLDMIAMGDEIISMVKRLVEGIRTSDDHLALDVVREVGPGGHFLNTDHTLKFFREHWEPSLTDRSNFETWSKKSGKDFGERANQEVKKMLKKEPAKLEKESKNELDEALEQQVKKIKDN